MSDPDHRIQDLNQLQQVYDNWQHLLKQQLHAIHVGLAMTMAILGGFALSGVIQLLFRRWERKYLHRLDNARLRMLVILQVLVAIRLFTIELLAKMRDVVEAETREDSNRAEKSWRELVRSHGLMEFAPTPTVVIWTSPSGLEITIRYVAKVKRRFGTSVLLRQAVLATLGLVKDEHALTNSDTAC